MVSNFRREDHALFQIRSYAILPLVSRRWVTKYRYKVLQGPMRERIRDIIMQTCQEMGVHIVKGVLGRDHVHMFLSIPPKLSLSDVMQRIKGRSSRRIQMEFPELRKRYWGRRFWARGDFQPPLGMSPTI